QQGQEHGALGELQRELQRLEQRYREAQQAQLRMAELGSLRSAVQETQGAIVALQAQIQSLKAELAAMGDLQTQAQHLQSLLSHLGDPRRQVQRLQQQLQASAGLDQRLAQIQAAVEPLAQQQQQLQQELATFADLEATIQQQEQQRHSYGPDYQTYLQQSQLAQQLPHYQQDLAQTLAELEQVRLNLGQIQGQITEAQANWNPQQLQRAEAELQRLQTERGQWAGALPEQRKALEQVRSALAQRQQWAEEHDRLEQEQQRKQGIYEFIVEARRIYNQSGPRITGFYLDEIRREGDRLFRELMNRQGVALTWSDDYEIQVQEANDWRSFRTLSGGEQMAAALAVRLALLKVLAELDIAFFDEPTTNMDRDRREQLAEALGNLRTFRQLFIISHDDTFENLTENVIRVEREVD
ncbi:MAG: SbcC/MukB-like Walker B domain-containing protein, partial [Prochlorothrix sp.]